MNCQYKGVTLKGLLTRKHDIYCIIDKLNTFPRLFSTKFLWCNELWLLIPRWRQEFHFQKPRCKWIQNSNLPPIFEAHANYLSVKMNKYNEYCLAIICITNFHYGTQSLVCKSSLSYFVNIYTNTSIYSMQIYLFITFMLVAIFLLKGSVCPTPRQTRSLYDTAGRDGVYSRLRMHMHAGSGHHVWFVHTYFIKMLNLWAVSEVLDIHVLAPTIKSLCKIYIAYELSRSKTHTCDLFKIDERS